MLVNKLSVRGLLPDTDYYMTYDGSTTAPACYETVTWIIVNKPIYITKQQVKINTIFEFYCQNDNISLLVMFTLLNYSTDRHKIRDTV